MPPHPTTNLTYTVTGRYKEHYDPETEEYGFSYSPSNVFYSDNDNRQDSSSSSRNRNQQEDLDALKPEYGPTSLYYRSTAANVATTTIAASANPAASDIYTAASAVSSAADPVSAAANVDAADAIAADCDGLWMNYDDEYDEAPGKGSRDRIKHLARLRYNRDAKEETKYQRHRSRFPEYVNMIENEVSHLPWRPLDRPQPLNHQQQQQQQQQRQQQQQQQRQSQAERQRRSRPQQQHQHSPQQQHQQESPQQQQ
ncbi:hypothetical protein BGW39_003141 [Mortierella sp. 14UC]|nr:hypothetical protein BGW39_003141 [Mortierella sp. 14UC]